MLIIFTGHGKGKTTAALGQAARLVGRGKRALMIQFIKGPWKSGEDRLLMHQRPAFGAVSETKDAVSTPRAFEIRKRGLGFVGILDDHTPFPEHKKAAEMALKEAEDEIQKNLWDLIILDEVNNAVHLNLLSAEEVLRVVALSAKEKFIILTGRDAPEAFLKSADLATEMKELKHPFNDGVMAKIALEF